MRYSSSWSSTAWWWVFGILIVLPATGLIVLGFWAIQAEQIEREQQIRDQQSQIARHAEAALANLLSSLEKDAPYAVWQTLKEEEAAATAGSSPPPLEKGGDPDFTVRRGFNPDLPPRGNLSPDLSAPDEHGLTVFAAVQGDVLLFPRDRLYVADYGARPAMVAAMAEHEWPAATLKAIGEAQSAEAQHRTEDALRLYGEVAQTTPKLKTWADFSGARLRLRSGAIPTLPFDPEADWRTARTPSGLPVLLLAAAEVDALSTSEASKSSLTILNTALRHLRNGTWWLSYEERGFYDRMLRDQLARGAESGDIVEDPRLAEIAAIAAMAREIPPSRANRATYHYATGTPNPFLLIWAPHDLERNARVGIAVPQRTLQEQLARVLEPLVSNASFTAGISDAEGRMIWTNGAAQERFVRSERMQTLPEWEWAYGAVRTDGWAGVQRVILYGFVLVLALMLGAGLAMTVRVLRRERELGRLQHEFVAAVSHEFKSPITGIRLLVERMDGRSENRRGHNGAYISTINTELDRLEWLINRILASQQLQTGSKQFVFVPASIVEIVRSTIGLLEPQAKAKHMHVLLDAADDIPELVVDRADITDAVRNVLDNAIKYSAFGTTVTARIHAENGTVKISVADEGIGIDADELSRIFEKFYRSRRGDELDVRGTGLGLALVKATAEGHGGTVTVASTPGAGSIFTIELPIGGHNNQHGQDSDCG